MGAHAGDGVLENPGHGVAHARADEHGRDDAVGAGGEVAADGRPVTEAPDVKPRGGRRVGDRQQVGEHRVERVALGRRRLTAVARPAQVHRDHRELLAQALDVAALVPRSPCLPASVQQQERRPGASCLVRDAGTVRRGGHARRRSGGFRGRARARGGLTGTRGLLRRLARGRARSAGPAAEREDQAEARRGQGESTNQRHVAGHDHGTPLMSGTRDCVPDISRGAMR